MRLSKLRVPEKSKPSSVYASAMFTVLCVSAAYAAIIV